VSGDEATLRDFRFSVTCNFQRSEAMRHVLSALVTNQPGVLAHISGMLASRAFNIDSLAVGETENPEFSRITFVVRGDDRVLDQVRKQLEKLVTVVKVLDFSKQNFVGRDLMLIKVSTEGQGSRTEVKELTEIFRGKIVDVSSSHVMIEISGPESKIEAFIDVMRPMGILELVRTGRIAMLRSAEVTVDMAEARPLAEKP
jgi:acetolactate synthase-1/3 small subunit